MLSEEETNRLRGEPVKPTNKMWWDLCGGPPPKRKGLNISFREAKEVDAAVKAILDDAAMYARLFNAWEKLPKDVEGIYVYSHRCEVKWDNLQEMVQDSACKMWELIVPPCFYKTARGRIEWYDPEGHWPYMNRMCVHPKCIKVGKRIVNVTLVCNYAYEVIARQVRRFRDSPAYGVRDLVMKMSDCVEKYGWNPTAHDLLSELRSEVNV